MSKFKITVTERYPDERPPVGTSETCEPPFAGTCETCEPDPFAGTCETCEGPDAGTFVDPADPARSPTAVDAPLSPLSD